MAVNLSDQNLSDMHDLSAKISAARASIDSYQAAIDAQKAAQDAIKAQLVIDKQALKDLIVVMIT